MLQAVWLISELQAHPETSSVANEAELQERCGWPHGSPVRILWLDGSSMLLVGKCWVSDGGSWRQVFIPECPAVSLSVQLLAQAAAQPLQDSDLVLSHT